MLTYLQQLPSYVLEDSDDIFASTDASGAIDSEEGALLHEFDVVKNRLYHRASRHTDTSGTNRMVQQTEDFSLAKRNEAKRDKVRRCDYTSLKYLYSSANSVFE